jgi:heterodisulfide reductase subunit A-like polyferredoxin
MRIAQVPDQDVTDMERTHSYNFDLAVLGGGSGGLACAKEAAKHGAKVIAACLSARCVILRIFKEIKQTFSPFENFMISNLK